MTDDRRAASASEFLAAIQRGELGAVARLLDLGADPNQEIETPILLMRAPRR